ncbi:hypothetical protein GCM10020367_16590 [Streptomyces sannanensis]|uniref:Zinc finger DksA/TraR C4-type domain-containing protein n=1 Tax=Streptomyces sannanensis TaxID=285536 RepID=A0ABP6S7U0_9ACTN
MRQPVWGGPATRSGKAPAGKASAGAGAGKKAGAGRAAAAGNSGAAKKAAKKAGKTRAAAEAAEQTGARKVVVKKTAGGSATKPTETPLPKARIAMAAAAEELQVRPGEDPWTPEEVAEARAELNGEVQRLCAELEHSEEAITGLMRDSGDGAGDDQADTGAKNITREHELALAANARDMLVQVERALGRLDAGTYGLCESCGTPIGKARMQAFPRATLCVECKQKQERRG